MVSVAHLAERDMPPCSCYYMAALLFLAFMVESY